MKPGRVATLAAVVLFAGVGVVAAPGVKGASSAQGAVRNAEDDQAAGERYYQRAVRYAKKRNYEKALEFFEKALPYKNSDSNLFYNLCMVAAPLKAWGKIVLYGQGFLFLEGTDSADGKDIAAKVERAEKLMRKKPRAVKFDVTPKGVELKVNHVPLARAQGAEVKLPPGKYTLRAFRDDYEKFEESFSVEAGEGVQTVTKAMKKKLFFGKLKIVTDPADGVEVSLDGKVVGTTPLKEPLRLETRKYLVKFSKPGYDLWQRYVTIEKDQTAELKPVLERSR